MKSNQKFRFATASLCPVSVSSASVQQPGLWHAVQGIYFLPSKIKRRSTHCLCYPKTKRALLVFLSVD